MRKIRIAFITALASGLSYSYTKVLTKEDILCAAVSLSLFSVSFFSVSFFIVFFFISVKRNMPLGIQGGQLNMAVFFKVPEKHDLV